MKCNKITKKKARVRFLWMNQTASSWWFAPSLLFFTHTISTVCGVFVHPPRPRVSSFICWFSIISRYQSSCSSLLDLTLVQLNSRKMKGENKNQQSKYFLFCVYVGASDGVKCINLKSLACLLARPCSKSYLNSKNGYTLRSVYFTKNCVPSFILKKSWNWQWMIVKLNLLFKITILVNGIH